MYDIMQSQKLAMGALLAVLAIILSGHNASPEDALSAASLSLTRFSVAQPVSALQLVLFHFCLLPAYT